MINELSRLAESIKGANIRTESWHQSYGTIPKVKLDSPCVRILMKEGKVSLLQSISSEVGKTLRKYGNNQGSFPAMNLAPLFRISDSNTVKTISAWIKADGVGTDLAAVRSWCVDSNWGEKFANKYRKSIIDRASELKTKINSAFEPLNTLIEAVKPLQNPEELHQQLFDTALLMIENGEDVRLALQVLFYLTKPEKTEDYGSLSVIFDCEDLVKNGIPTISLAFTQGLNAALLSSESSSLVAQNSDKLDAFGMPYRVVGNTMPKVTLPVGFDVTLRTMFDGQPCQYRYGKIENGSYPISTEKAMEIKTSFEWLAKENNKNKTWTKTGKNEAFFAYPSKIPTSDVCKYALQSFAGDAENREADFLAISEDFTDYITKIKKLDPDNYPDNIQLFAINKYDKARSRIAYSRYTTPDVVIEQSKNWRAAANNLPSLWKLNSPNILFPLSVAPVMNRIWKRDGTLASDKYRHTDRYYGVELFFGVPKSALLDSLSEVVHNSENMAVFACTALRSNKQDTKNIALFLNYLKETLSIMGMYLFWIGIRKDDYMNEYPYLFGQLLKISDSIHELYCIKVRKGVPTQLLGSAMYSAAAEMPLQTFALLSTRVQPYLSWCKANREECMEWTDRNGKTHLGFTAGYYLYQYELIANKLKKSFSLQTRFSDIEKAQLFIGYLASFEKSTNDDDTVEQMKGEDEND